MVLSDALCLAARNGDVAAIQAWLEAGGDPDERTGPDTVDLHRPHEIGQTLLHWAVGREEYRVGELPADVENRRNDVVRMLLAHGATVDALPERINNTPLFIAALRGRTESVEQLCLAGANVNHTRSSGDFPLWHATGRWPNTVRVLLRFGADPSMTYLDDPSTGPVTPEEYANRRFESYYGSRYRECARLLADARLLRPRLQGIFSLRALCHRGRAAPTLETPPAFTRLIGGSAPASRPRTRAAKVLASPGLPDPLAHLVCKFWLGEPPRRRRAAPATE